MSNSTLVFLFLAIVLAPCLVALLASSFADGVSPGEIYVDKWRLPRRRGSEPVAVRAMFAELPIAEDFEIRSFPKGISQRRLLVRDSEEGVKLTIGQLRAAAVELCRLGGMAAAYEFALVAAASAARMGAVKNAFALAAGEALETARNATAWFAWSDPRTREGPVHPSWDGSPHALETPFYFPMSRWEEATEAA
jgi:hypothetical protein